MNDKKNKDKNFPEPENTQIKKGNIITGTKIAKKELVNEKLLNCQKSDIRDIEEIISFINKVEQEINKFYIKKNKNLSVEEKNQLRNDFENLYLKKINNSLSQNDTSQFITHLLKNKNKYTEVVEKALESPFLPVDCSQITIKFFTNNDLFIGKLESGSFPSEIDQNFPSPEQGILYSENGEYYEGEFSNGKKEGNGIITYKKGTKYEGSLENNFHHGVGKLTQLDGEIFIGEWKKGKINGKGIRYHSNGDKYIGNFINNIRCGQGNYYFVNGDVYEGNWSGGKANGQGKFKFKNGNIYEGEFKDNIISGKGIFKTKNGDEFIGVFTNGLINGIGTMINNKGEKYVGNFKGGKKDGEGKIYDKDGNIIKCGKWNADKFLG